MDKYVMLKRDGDSLSVCTKCRWWLIRFHKNRDNRLQVLSKYEGVLRRSTGVKTINELAEVE